MKLLALGVTFCALGVGFIALRMFFVKRAVAWAVGYAMPFQRKLTLPSMTSMVLRFWVWDPLKLINDTEYLEHRKNKTGPYEHLHPDFEQKMQARLAEMAHRHEEEMAARGTMDGREKAVRASVERLGGTETPRKLGKVSSLK